MLSFIFYYYYFFTLQYCIGFAIHQHESATGVHVFPILNPLPPPSPYHPSGSSQCTTPSILYPASNLDWQFIPYMILYMFNNQHQRECKEEGIVSWGEGDTIVRNRFTLHYIFLYIYIYCLFD